MLIKQLIAAAALFALVAGPAVAQTAQTPAKPVAPAAAKPGMAPMAPMAPAATQKVNLNTASATDLDKLPQIGPARAKAIITARTKAPFKDWNDFVTRKVVPSNAQKAIQNQVTF